MLCVAELGASMGEVVYQSSTHQSPSKLNITRFNITSSVAIYFLSVLRFSVTFIIHEFSFLSAKFNNLISVNLLVVDCSYSVDVFFHFRIMRFAAFFSLMSLILSFVFSWKNMGSFKTETIINKYKTYFQRYQIVLSIGLFFTVDASINRSANHEPSSFKRSNQYQSI